MPRLRVSAAPTNSRRIEICRTAAQIFRDRGYDATSVSDVAKALGITKAGLYDTLIAVILPTAAFSLPISTIIMTGSMRDITGDLYEAMALEGASSWDVFRHLVMPLARGGLATIIVFSALNAWNGFLLPLILTQSASVRVFTLGLYDFQTVSSIDAPAICAAVVLSIIPILVVYLFARRALIQGLMGVGGK